MDLFFTKNTRFFGIWKYCDGTLRTEDGYMFGIHRVMLALKSHYFRALFGSSLYDDPQRCVLMKQVHGATMWTVLSYLYTDEVEVRPNNVGDLLVAADYLLIHGIVDQCCARIRDLITADNCFDLIHLATALPHLSIYSVCYRFIQTNFGVVMRQPAAGSLPHHTLTSLLQEDSLRVSDEAVAWDAVVQWISQKPEERLPHVPKLMSCLRLEDMSEDTVRQMLSHPFVLDNGHCSPLRWHLQQNTGGGVKENCVRMMRNLHGEKCQQKRQPRRRYLFVKQCYFPEEFAEGVKVYLTYDGTIDPWSKIARRPHLIPKHIEVVGHQLFAFQRLGDQPNYRLDLVTRQWHPIAPLLLERDDSCVVRCGPTLYAIGGQFLSQPTRIVERYDPQRHAWSLARFMPVASVVTSVVLEGLVYTLGKTRNAAGEVDVLVARVYDPVLNVWAELGGVAPPYRCDFAMVAVGVSFLVIGGKNEDGQPLASVYQYDVRRREWALFRELPVTFRRPKAVVLDGAVVVYEDHFSGKKYGKTNQPVYWDATRNEWRGVNDSSYFNELYRCQFCVVDDALANRRLRDFVQSAEWTTPFKKRLAAKRANGGGRDVKDL